MTRFVSIDWPTVLGDIAWLLGEPDAVNADRRVPCSQEQLATALQIPRGTLRGWMAGSEPKWGDGERVIERWCALTGKSRSFVPLAAPKLTAAQMR